MLNNRMTNNRKKQRWYNCDLCGFQYPESKVIRFNGRVACQGSNTCGCVDKPGFRAEMKKIIVPREVRPQPLPDVNEDL